MQDIPSSPVKSDLQQEISLFKELLDCLEREWQALISSQEDAILALAAQKEHTLEKIIRRRCRPGSCRGHRSGPGNP
jgi:flagellar biosynthesis/type III secretory pathway chaperone